MWLIAEGGASKIEWRLCEGVEVRKNLRSKGFNPNVQSVSEIQDTVSQVFSALDTDKLEEILYYGAGYGAEGHVSNLKQIFQQLAPQAEVHIFHDLAAAVRSTLRDEGIVCILGTGSHSALHNSGKVLQEIGGQGYLLGDEGSGADLGKMFLKLLLQEDLPAEIRQYVEEKEGKTLLEIRTEVYRSERPNVRMANLAPHISALLEHSCIQEMVENRFLAFFDTSVTRYPHYKNYSVDFVGSIAHHFLPQLQKAAAKREIRLGNIVPNPIDNLLQWHYNAKLS